jgi:hypothetical protein
VLLFLLKLISNWYKLDYGDNFNLDLRKKADEAFQNSSVQPTSIFNGAFIDVMIQPQYGSVKVTNHVN